MAVYDVGGEEYEIPDDVQGDKLQSVLRGIIQRKKQQQPQIDVAAMQAERETRQPVMPAATSGVSRGWDVDPGVGQGQSGGAGVSDTWATSAQLTPEEMDSARLARVARTPEITGQMGKLSENVGFLQSVAGMTAFDPDELGKILTAADPAIGIATTPEGERIAVNNQTGRAFSINKLGPSLMDAVQVGGALAAFAPSGRASTIAGQALAGMATQTAIEAGQKAMGGDFNKRDVAIAGAAPVAMSAVAKGVGAGIKKIRGAEQYIDDLASGRPVLPADASVSQRAGLPAKEAASRAQIRNAIREGSAESVGWTVDDLGRVIPDSVQRELVRKGVNDKAIVTLRDMSATDRKIALEMLEKAERNVKKLPNAEFDLPNSIIGRQAMKRFDVLAKGQEKASFDIGRAVKSELKNKPVDVSQEFDEMLDSLEALKVNVFAKNGPDFTESLINSSNITPIKNVLARAKANYSDASELHELKRYITDQIKYTAKSQKPLDERAQNILKAFRAKINQRLRGMSDAYAEANDRFADAANALKPFAESMGKRFDPESDRVADYVGQELRKTLSNYNVSSDLVTAIKTLDETAARFGAKFDDNILNQVVLNSELERVFGSFKPNSLQGVEEKAGDLVMGKVFGPAGELVKEAKNKVSWSPPVKDKMEIIKQLKEIASR